MATVTATSAIEQAQTQLGVLREGGSATTAQKNAALITAQYLIENANLQPGMWVGLATTSFTPTAATQAYTIAGIGISPRPPKIVAAAMTNNGIMDPIHVIQDARQWTGIMNSKSQTRMPRILFYDRNTTGNIYIAPVPLAAGAAGSITLWYPQVQANFADLTTAVTLLPGYGRWLIFALAIDLCAAYGMPIPPTVQDGYLKSVQAIQQLNAELFIPGDALPPTDKGNAV